MHGERLNSALDGPDEDGWRPRRTARTARGPLVLSMVLATMGTACSGPQSEQLSCEDVLPPGSVEFTPIQELVLQSPRRSGCVSAPCHSASAQSGGIRLDEPKLIYDELSARPELFYAVLASGEMPQRGRPWSSAELRLLRSWYCDGAFPP